MINLTMFDLSERRAPVQIFVVSASAKFDDCHQPFKLYSYSNRERGLHKCR
jgi:hypothetical protein